MKLYLDKFKTTESKEDKAQLIVDVLTYIAKEGYPVCVIDAKFRRVVIEKIQEIRRHGETLSVLTPEVKSLAFALCGVRC